MSLRGLAAAIGKVGTLTTTEGLKIEVRVLDARQAYGRTEYLVAPTHGKGEAWVTTARVRLKR
jgi:hypothetical protein